MSNDITLSSAQRQTLLSLQTITNLSDRTQIRLATGRKINDVTDGPEDYFAARTLEKRAGLLNGRRDEIDQGISTIQAALEGIDALDEFLGQLRGLTRQARSQTEEERAETTRSYNSVVAQFQNLLEDTSYQGLNLLNNVTADLTVKFSEEEDSLLVIDSVNILATAAGTGGVFGGRPFINNSSGSVRGIAGTINGLNAGVGLSSGFSVLSNGTNLQSLNTLDARLSDAQDRLESRANVLGNHVAVLQTRLNYTDNLISNHITGSDKIKNADLNEEAANLTATGTQYQIGVQALGVAGQRVQSLLQVIR
ncbi:MAG: hypothetical protein K0U45_10185 [Alphaproteobacteria bacterium]|nr:hypothetical protein [Alphaproteobacteria bacterium]